MMALKKAALILAGLCFFAGTIATTGCGPTADDDDDDSAQGDDDDDSAM